MRKISVQNEIIFKKPKLVLGNLIYAMHSLDCVDQYEVFNAII